VGSGSGGLDGAAGFAFGPDGNLYVVSNHNSEVLRYDGTTGAFIDTFVGSGSGGLNDPISLTFVPVPEPGTLAMLGSAVLGLAGILRSRINL